MVKRLGLALVLAAGMMTAFWSTDEAVAAESPLAHACSGFKIAEEANGELVLARALPDELLIACSS